MIDFVRLLREKFTAGLQAKTGWGRSEVQRLFDGCVADAAVEVAAREERDRQDTDEWRGAVRRSLSGAPAPGIPPGCPRCGAYPSNGLC